MVAGVKGREEWGIQESHSFVCSVSVLMGVSRVAKALTNHCLLVLDLKQHGFLEDITVLQSGPSSFGCCLNRMLMKIPPKWNGRALIEERVRHDESKSARLCQP